MKTKDKIKMLRKRAGMTQTELGEKLGVKKNAVCKWERGVVDVVPASKLKAMAELFNVPFSFLYAEDEDENKEILEKYMMLSDKDKEFIMKQIEFFLNR